MLPKYKLKRKKFEKWGGSPRSVFVQDPTKELEENLKKVGAANKLLYCINSSSINDQDMAFHHWMMHYGIDGDYLNYSISWPSQFVRMQVISALDTLDSCWRGVMLRKSLSTNMDWAVI